MSLLSIDGVSKTFGGLQALTDSSARYLRDLLAALEGV